jgi:hypothetical protein
LRTVWPALALAGGQPSTEVLLSSAGELEIRSHASVNVDALAIVAVIAVRGALDELVDDYPHSPLDAAVAGISIDRRSRGAARPKEEANASITNGPV